MGIGVIELSAPGASFRKVASWPLERASAMELFVPCMWEIRIWKWFEAARKYSLRTRHMIAGTLDECRRHISTTAKLSQWNRMRRPVHRCSHVIVATTIAYSSCHVMEIPVAVLVCWCGSHGPLSQEPLR